MRDLSFCYFNGVTRWLPIAAIVIALGVVAGAQQAADQQPVPEQPQTDGQTRVFRSGVTLVTTDLIPRDSDGLFVSDLGLDDLVVYEDDVPQEIASLVLVQGGRVYNQLLPPPPVQEGIVLPRSRPVDSTAGRVFVIFVDDLHLERSLTPKIRQVFQTVADTLIHEGDLFGIVSTGPSALAIDMTYDRAVLADAKERIMGDGFSTEELVKSMGTGAGGRGPEELRFRTNQAFNLARKIVGNLENVKNRRKAFIYLSSGYDFNPFEMERLRQGPIGEALRRQSQIDSVGLGTGEELDSYHRLTDAELQRYQQTQNIFGGGFNDTDLALEMALLAKAANRANASFYTIDPRGLVAGRDIEFEVSSKEWNEYMFQTQNSLRTLAYLTGGMAVVNRNNFEDALRQIDEETGDYYVLGFYSSNPDPTLVTRRLKVEVNRPGVTARYRTHYSFAQETAGDAPQ